MTKMEVANHSMFSQLRTFLSQKIVRVSLVVLIIFITVSVFVQYIVTHPSAVFMLSHLSPKLLVFLAASYLLTILANAWILHSSLALLDKKTPLTDNFLLTSYSSIVNFFGPLQSGPGVRAAYLKARYQVRIRDFIAVSFIFYAFFGILNLIILAVATLYKWPNFSLLYICTLGVSMGLTALLLRRPPSTFYSRFHKIDVTSRNFWLIGVGTLGLIVSSCLVYFGELHHIDSQVSIWQTLIYTAAANLALFVSLTPGAIGFRETFLVFSEKLHGLPTSTILSANIIDRAFYVIFLGVLFIVILLIGSRLKSSLFKITK